MHYIMVGFIAAAISLTPEERVNIRLCSATRQSIILQHNGKLRDVPTICKQVMDASDLMQDEALFEECWEYLSFCKN